MAKKKKWKKRLGKALAAGAALAGGLALARRRATDAPGNAMASAKRAMTTDRAYTGGGYDDPIMTGGVGVKFNRRNMYSPNDFGLGPYDGAKDGGRIGAKKGGRVGCGVAKKGFGKALKKGGK